MNYRLDHGEYAPTARRYRSKGSRINDCSSNKKTTVVVVLLLSLLSLLGWQYRASVRVAVLDSSSTATTKASKTSSAIPGSILSADTGLAMSSLRPPLVVSTSQRGKTPPPLHQNTTTTTKTILYFTKFWDKDDFLFGQGRDVFTSYNCPVSDCWATSHKTALPSLSDFDAVLFHPLDMPHEAITTLSTWRRPHQQFVMVHMESPLLYPRVLNKFPAFFFNWTMTYVQNADIVRPYGYFVPKRQEQHEHQSSFHYAHLPAAWIQYNATRFRNALPQRSAGFRKRFARPYQVAWIVSNCHTPSKREAFVAELSKFINVTIFGRCSNQTTSSTQRRRPCDKACYDQIRKSYKFIVGLENSHCTDYVTEKFFGRVQDFVVLVNGAAHHDDSYQRLAPPHSHINIADFTRPADLAHYLHQLAQNETAYLSYFWWQEYYQVLAAAGNGDEQAKRRFFAQSMCRLCERLHYQADDASSAYTNVSEWFNQQGQCTVPDSRIFGS